MRRSVARRSLATLLAVLAVPASARELRDDALPGLGQAQRPAPDARGADDPAGADPALPFVSTRELRAATVAREVQALRAKNPIAAAETARELARHDYDAVFRGFLDGTGLRGDEAGDVLTAFVALQWMVANDAAVEPSPAALRAIRRQFVAPMAVRPPLSQGATRAAFAEQVKLRAVLHHAGWLAAKRLGVMPRFLAGLSSEFIPAAKLQALALTDGGLVARSRAGSRAVTDPAAPPPADAAPPVADARPARTLPADPAASSGPSPAPDVLAAPRHADNWDAVEGVYFRSTPSFGVGGMMIMDFEPLIFLRDGTYFEIADAALEDVDLSAERIARPRRFGRWTRASGGSGGFVLTGDKGKPNDYRLGDGSFFRAFPAASGETVARSYRRLSGGGNSAMGGDVAVAVERRYAFRADGSYGQGGSVGAINSGASTGVGSALSRRRVPEGGRYALDRHTLTLTGADGRVRRHFFAYSAQGSPQAIDRDMIFVGGDVFTSDD